VAGAVAALCGVGTSAAPGRAVRAGIGAGRGSGGARRHRAVGVGGSAVTVPSPGGARPESANWLSGEA
jgi:hypothetical protein